eukprot:2213171-Rhodomonas_salina.1
MAIRCDSGCILRRSAWSNVQSGRAAALLRGTMPTAARTLREPCIGSHTHLPGCLPVMQPRMAPSGEPGTARPEYSMQSTRARSILPFWPVSSHAQGTGINARTAHSCVASVESSSRETIVVARGRWSAAERRMYRPSSSRPVITPTSTGGGTQSASVAGVHGLWERRRRADSVPGSVEASESSLPACRWTCHAHLLSVSVENHCSRGSI